MKNEIKKILIISGTRADYGKIKSVAMRINNNSEFSLYIFVTGMNLLKKYGNTYKYILKDNLGRIKVAKKVKNNLDMELALSKNIKYISNYVKKSKPDMIIVHGDRLEALAGAIVGAFRNILVSHIEGGEISGTIDEKIRHTITKLSNFHFVANDISKKRLIQMGEKEKNIFVVGSPDIDIMLFDKLDTLKNVKSRYNIMYKNYAICIYHPVTTNLDETRNDIKVLMKALSNSNENYIIIYPNNDMGSEYIIEEYKEYENNLNFTFFKSLKFEDFIVLLKNCKFVIGNSSVGIRECGVVSIPSINLGSRQNLRINNNEQFNIQSLATFNEKDILNSISKVNNYRIQDTYFGKGNSGELIEKILQRKEIWKEKVQKNFIDINFFTNSEDEEKIL